jgi:hypothetical protein
MTIPPTISPNDPPVPRWLRIVLVSDYVGTAWYIVASVLFAPVLAALSPWPTVTTVLWWIIGLTGLSLGLLGIAVTIGLTKILRSGVEIPQQYWRSIAPRGWPDVDGMCRHGADTTAPIRQYVTFVL